jgi:site-specific DNA recombinase
MKERIKKGYWPGGGKVPYGYDYDKQSGILVQNNKAEDIRKMFDLYLNGWSAERIARRFGIKYDKIVMQILKSHINCGMIEYRGEVFEGLHEPIVSRQVFEETNMLIEKRSRAGTKQGSFLLSGLIYCGKCAGRMRYQKWGKSGYKICCYSQQSNKDYMVKDPNCDNKKTWAYEIEDAVVAQLFAFSLNPELIKIKRTSEKADELNAAKKQLASLNRRIKNLVDFIAEGIATQEIKKELADLPEQKKQVAETIEKNHQKKDNTQRFISRIQNLKDIWDDLNAEQKKSVVQLLIDKIVITDDKIVIFYTFE